MKLHDLTETQFSKVVRKFASSVFFPLFITVTCYISWAFSLVFVGLGIAAVLFVILMVTQKNSIYTFPIFLLIFYMIPDFKEAYYFTGIYLGLCVAAAVYNILVYKVKLDKGGLFYPILATFFAAAVGGIIYTTITYEFWKYIKDTLFILLLTVSFGGGYLFFNSTVSTKDVDYKKYISIAFYFLSLLLIAEMVTYYLRADDIIAAIANKRLRIGWGNTNTLATMLMVTIPFILYLASQYRYGAFLTIWAALVYCAIWITQSRGCILCSTPLLAFYVIYLIVKSKGLNKYLLIANVGFLLLAAGVLCIIFRDYLYDIFAKMLQKGLDDSGRIELYQEAWELFKKHFIFGTGYFYKTDTTSSFMYMFHSTPLQIMANLGVVGVIAFGYFYFYKYKILLKNIKNSFGMAIIVSLLSLELYGLIDVSLVVYFMAITTILLLIIAQKNIIENEPEMKK
jgi:hypothetical protein